jgi:hypothetical protein
MALYNESDRIWAPEAQRAGEEKLRRIYETMKCPGNYRGAFYPGGHKFDRAMQKDAFDWFDGQLK